MISAHLSPCTGWNGFLFQMTFLSEVRVAESATTCNGPIGWPKTLAILTDKTVFSAEIATEPKFDTEIGMW